MEILQCNDNLSHKETATKKRKMTIRHWENGTCQKSWTPWLLKGYNCIPSKPQPGIIWFWFSFLFPKKKRKGQNQQICDSQITSNLEMVIINKTKYLTNNGWKQGYVRTFTGQLLLKMLCMAVFQEVQRAPHQGRNLLWDRHEFWSAHSQR